MGASPYWPSMAPCHSMMCAVPPQEELGSQLLPPPQPPTPSVHPAALSFSHAEVAVPGPTCH